MRPQYSSDVPAGIPLKDLGVILSYVADVFPKECLQRASAINEGMCLLKSRTLLGPGAAGVLLGWGYPCSPSVPVARRNGRMWSLRVL